MEQGQKQLLTFGYGLPVILAVLGLGHWHKHGFDTMAAALLAVATAALLTTIYSKPLLQVLFKYWMKAAHMIGGIIIAVILTVLFFTVFTAVGVILRLLRKDLLQLRMGPQTRSYWVIRSEDEKDPTRYLRQF